MNDVIDLTLEDTSLSSQLPPSSPLHPDSDTPESESSESGSSLRWYKKVNTHLGDPGHPYICQGISVVSSCPAGTSVTSFPRWVIDDM